MAYEDFLWETGNFLENEVETNIRYDKKSLEHFQVLWYVLDTYYKSKVCYYNTDDNLTLKIKGLLEFVAAKIGGCDLDLNYIPHEHMFYWTDEPSSFHGYSSYKNM